MLPALATDRSTSASLSSKQPIHHIDLTGTAPKTGRGAKGTRGSEPSAAPPKEIQRRGAEAAPHSTPWNHHRRESSARIAAREWMRGFERRIASSSPSYGRWGGGGGKAKNWIPEVETTATSSRKR